MEGACISNLIQHIALITTVLVVGAVGWIAGDDSTDAAPAVSAIVEPLAPDALWAGVLASSAGPVPTPTPTPTPGRAVDVGAGYLTEGEVRELAGAAGFTWDVDWLVALTLCEAEWNARAVGSEWYQGRLWYFYGLMQIAHRDPPGPVNEWLRVPYINLVEGHLQYAAWQAGERSNPWPNCP